MLENPLRGARILKGMTSPENPIKEAAVPAAGTSGRIHPRPVLDRLPKYAAGKPPTAIEGLQSYKLSSNENPLPPLPAVLEAVNAQTDIMRYPDPLCTALRTELSRFLGVPADDIVTGAGSLGALVQILQTFAGQHEDGSEDEVVYAWRSFEAYPIMVGLSGARSVQIPNRADGTHDLEAMLDAVTDRTKVILLCTPNNPTGPALTAAAVEDFVGKVRDDIIVVIDEAYTEFVRDPEVVDGVAMYRKYPNVVVLRTFSKAHGLAGLRVGYSISQPEITQHLRVAATPFAVSSLAEHAAITSLRNYDEVVERVQSLVDERDRVVAGLKMLGWKFPQTQGNFVWLPLGDRAQEFAELAGRQALSVRAFAGEGVRVSIGEVEANSRFLALCENYTNGPGVS